MRRPGNRHLLAIVDAIYRTVLDPETRGNPIEVLVASLHAPIPDRVHVATHAILSRAAKQWGRAYGPETCSFNFWHRAPLSNDEYRNNLFPPLIPGHYLHGYQRLDFSVFAGLHESGGGMHRSAFFPRIQYHSPGSTGSRHGTTAQSADPGDRGRSAYLDRHLERALEWAQWMRMADTAIRCTDAFMQLYDLAAIVCRSDTHLVWASTDVENYLRSGILRIRPSTGTVHLRDPEADTMLNTALQRIEEGESDPFEFPLGERGERSGIWCIVIPLAAYADRSLSGRRMAAIALQPPSSSAAIDSQRLIYRLRLSPAEGDVLAGLMQGENLAAIAARRGSARETIRGYVKSAQRKLRCHSQAELVTTGWRAIAVIPRINSLPARSGHER